MAIPRGGLWCLDACFPVSPTDDHLLCWTIWCCERGAATVLPSLRSTHDGKTLRRQTSVLEDHSAGPFTSQVPVGSGVEGETTSLR